MTAAVQSVDRALSLLELIAETPDGARLSDLARAAGLAPSTTHRLLTALEQKNFVQSDAANAKWRIGRKAHVVGAAWGTARTVLAPAALQLRRLRDATRETANLGIIEDGHVLNIQQAESREIMRAISSPGGRTPIFCSGMGKAIVATWDDEQIDNLMRIYGLPRATSNSLTNPHAVRREIEWVRQKGFAMDDEEYVIGLRCVAAAIHDASGEAVAAVSVSGLAARMTEAKVARCIELVTKTAKQLSGKLEV